MPRVKGLTCHVQKYKLYLTDNHIPLKRFKICIHGHIYIFKGISPIKVEISELLTKKEENTNKLKLNINNNKKSPKIKKKKTNLKTEVKIKSKSKSCKNLTNNNKKLKKIYRKSDVEVLEIKRKKKSNFYKKISFPVKKKKISVKSYIIKNNPKRPYLHEVRYSKKSFDKLESKTITSDKSNLKFILIL